jgi:hypothetical protein
MERMERGCAGNQASITIPSQVTSYDEGPHVPATICALDRKL